MNGDSLTKASSRHSMVCETKRKQKNPLKTKKQEIKRSFVGKNTNDLLEMQCCKIIGEKKRVYFGVKTQHDKTTAMSADTCVTIE